MSNLGAVYQKQGDYPKALETYLQCLEIKKHNSKENLIEKITILNNIGSIYAKQDNLTKGIEYLSKSLEIC